MTDCQIRWQHPASCEQLGGKLGVELAVEAWPLNRKAHARCVLNVRRADADIEFDTSVQAARARTAVA